MASKIRSRSTAPAALALLLLLAAPAGAATHMGQATAEHVNVHFFGGMSGGDCPDQQGSTTLYMQRLYPDGQVASFSIPKGKVLVVTDFEFTARPYEPLGARTSLRAALWLKPAGSKSGGSIAWRDSFHLSEDLVSKLFVVGGQSLSGILVGDTAALCPTVSYDDGGSEPLIITGGSYRGYLIDADSPAEPREDPTPTDDTGSDELR